MARHTANEPYRRVLASDQGEKAAVTEARQVAPNAHFVLLNAFQVPFQEKLRFGGVDVDTVQLYRRQARATATE